MFPDAVVVPIRAYVEWSEVAQLGEENAIA
jgi:hypothetical protein